VGNAFVASVGNYKTASPEELKNEVARMSLEERLERARKYINDNVSLAECAALLKASAFNGGQMSSAPGTQELRTILEEKIKGS